MSNQLAGAEKMKTASVRVHEDLLEDFDSAVEKSSRWDSRSEAFRGFIESVVDNPDVEETDGRTPPTDDDLAAAYETLRALTMNGYVTEDRVLSVLAQQQGMNKTVARQILVIPLVERGYAKRLSNITGDTAVKALW